RRRTEGAAHPNTPPLVRRVTSGPRQTSFAQQRLWFLSQLDPTTPVYNVPDVIALDGAIDWHVLQRALSEIVRRHEVLRTTIVAVNGVPMQAVAPPNDLDLPCDDWRRVPAAQRQRLYESARQDEANRPFDLARGPLVRARLVRLTHQDARLLLTVHHAVADGWSLEVLRRELHALLDAFPRDAPSPLRQLPIQYGDYAEWQRERLQGELLERLMKYWRQQLAGAPLRVELPSDRPRPSVQTYAGAMVTTRIPATLTGSLQALSAAHRPTLFATLLAAFAVLLARYSGQRDLVIGTPVAGRTHTEMEPLIGLFVNTLPLRIDLSDDPTFSGLLRRTTGTALAGFARQDLPFDRLVAERAPPPRADVSPLVQVLFDLQRRRNDHVATVPPGEIVEFPDGVAKFELTLAAIEDADGLIASLEYNTNRFDAASARRMLLNFQHLLASITEDAECRCSRLPLVDSTEREILLSSWSSHAPVASRARCLLELIQAQIRRTPEAIAVWGDS